VSTGRHKKEVLKPLMAQRIDDHDAVIVRLSSDAVERRAAIKQAIGSFGSQAGHGDTSSVVR
jgi:hypothetical protein